MPKERGNPEIVRTFKAIGGFAEKKTDLWHAVNALRFARGEVDTVDIEEGGHPDYTVLVPPFGFFVEVKSAATNFPLADLSPKQRDWLDEFQSISWLWLFMGTAINARSAPRRAWLIPWPQWRRVEARLERHGLKGLPYDLPHRREHRDLGLSARQLLKRYALDWQGEGAWAIPAGHPFWTQALRHVGRFKPARQRARMRA
jgi:hypothetical protein